MKRGKAPVPADLEALVGLGIDRREAEKLVIAAPVGNDLELAQAWVASVRAAATEASGPANMELRRSLLGLGIDPCEVEWLVMAAPTGNDLELARAWTASVRAVAAGGHHPRPLDEVTTQRGGDEEEKPLTDGPRPIDRSVTSSRGNPTFPISNADLARAAGLEDADPVSLQIRTALSQAGRAYKTGAPGHSRQWTEAQLRHAYPFLSVNGKLKKHLGKWGLAQVSRT